MAKFLIFSNIQVFPPQSGSQQRTANLAHSLARAGHSVQVYSLTGRRSDYLSRRGDFTTQVSALISERVSMNIFTGVLQWLSYKVDIPPFWATLFTKVWRPRFFKQALATAEILVCDFPFLYPWLGQGQGPTLFNAHNVEWRLWEQVPGRRWLVPLVRFIEKKAVAAAASIFACSKVDIDTLKEVTTDSNGSKFFLVPNGIDEALYVRQETKRTSLRDSYGILPDERVILFAGSNYGPNHEGLEFLLKFTDQHAKELEESKLKFLVVGTVSKERKIVGPVILSGYVDDFEGHFSAADYAINPMFSGSGTNVKLSQYIAANLPIMTTRFGARGFNLSPKLDALIFDPSSLMDQIKVLHDSPNLQISLAENARKNNADLINMYPSVSRWLEQSLQD